MIKSGSLDISQMEPFGILLLNLKRFFFFPEKYI